MPRRASTELTGAPPPADLERAPVAAASRPHPRRRALAAMSAPAARAAQAPPTRRARKRRRPRRPLPQVGVGIDAGRYGVFENDRDYDIRGRVTVRQRLFGGTEARADQARARPQADARATRMREEAARDAAIAWSDVRALEEQLKGAGGELHRQPPSRDVLPSASVNARGDLFDVVEAEDAYFETATAYIQALSELDAARYVLLSRTGRLLPTLDIDPAAVGGQSERRNCRSRCRKPRFAPWLMEPMRRNRSIYIKVALAAVVINIFGLVTSLFTMTVYDRVVPNNATSSLIALSIGLAIVIIFDFMLKMLRAYFVDIAGARSTRKSATRCSSACSRSASSSRRAPPARSPA
jgi:hypothetical protein